MAVSSLTKLIFIFFIILSIFTSQTQSVFVDCSSKTNECNDKVASYPIKIIAIFAIFFSSILGVCTPLFTRAAPALQHDYRKNIIVVVKACASGVILATGFIHVLPDSFEMLSSNCLDDGPWHKFPFSGFVTMLSALVALMVDSLATSLFGKKSPAIGVTQAIEMNIGREDQDIGCTDTPGHFHRHNSQDIDSRRDELSELLRYRVIAVVLELGVIVHSMVIGLTLGVSHNVCTLKGLLPALCFHQMIEGVGLGGFILQAEYRFPKRTMLVFLFSVMTPLGIVLGLAVAKTYKENSPTATVTVGLLNACSAGLLIYMSLVDFLAAEFMSPKLQGNIKLQVKSYIALLLGAGGMSLMARWA